MGIINAKVLLKNPRRPEMEPVEADALGDTGSVFLCIPRHIQLQLDLEENEKREVTLADGSKKMVPYVGPVEIRFKNRTAYTGAIVLGDQVLFGAIPMEDMDLIIIPQTRTIDVNPASPNFASAIAK
jgi:clan AA aspartic protease